MKSLLSALAFSTAGGRTNTQAALVSVVQPLCCFILSGQAVTTKRFGFRCLTSYVVLFFQDKQSLLSSLAFSTAGGRTNTQAALNLLHTDVFTVVNGDRVGVANRAVVVTDGRSNIEHSNTAREAEDARDAGIEIYVVAVGNNVDRGEANDIASNPDSSHVYDLVDVDVVDRVSDFLLQELCQ